MTNETVYSDHTPSNARMFVTTFFALAFLVCVLMVSVWATMNWLDGCGLVGGQCHAVSWVDVPQ